MSRVFNVLEGSLAHNTSVEAIERRKDTLKRNPRPVNRAVSLLLHEMAIRHPDITGRLINRDLRSTGLTYAGAGAESTVYRRGSQAVKVIRKSIGLSEDELSEIAARKVAEHNLMRQHLSDLMLDQVVGIDAHPVVPKLRAVQITQPFCQFKILDLFDSAGVQLDEEFLATVCARYPFMCNKLSSLVEGGLHMYEKDGFLPDISGYCNIVMLDPDSHPQLTILDGQPVGPDHSRSQTKILGQIASIREALPSLAA